MKRRESVVYRTRDRIHQSGFSEGVCFAACKEEEHLTHRIHESSVGQEDREGSSIVLLDGDKRRLVLV